MIELPEAHSLAGQAQTLLTGKRIERIDILASPHKFAFFSGDPQQYGEILHRKCITGAEAYGGHMILKIEDYRLDFGDGINLRYHASEDSFPKKHQCLFLFDDGTAFSVSVQMYGFINLYHEDACDDGFLRVAIDKPSPLTPDFTLDLFKGIVAGCKPKLSVKALLATEQRIPGLGNGVLQDILFNARIHPRTPIASLQPEDIERLFNSVKETLISMTLRGGRDVEKDWYGIPGGYKTRLSSKTHKDPCPVCGGEIVRQAYLGGNVYFCPVCQPLS